jgi:hypothetical protein
MSNIFRAGNSCAYQIRNDLLIGTIAFLTLAPLLSVPRPAGLQSPDPYTPWRSLGGGRKSSYSFLTSALDGGWVSGQHHALPPGKGPPVPIGQEAGWAPEPIWTQRLEEKSSASVGDRIPVVKSVVSHY